MGWIFTAFQLAYGLFEIPTGRWADRVGTRSVLARIVIWWSVMTMATAAAASYVTMLVVRFLFGAGEAGAWPGVARTFSRWIPQAGARPGAGDLLLRRAPRRRIDARPSSSAAGCSGRGPAC